MTRDLQDRREALLDQLENTALSPDEISAIERKLEILDRQES